MPTPSWFKRDPLFNCWSQANIYTPETFTEPVRLRLRAMKLHSFMEKRVTLLQKPEIEKPSTTLRVGELRFITLAGPEELTLQALSPEQRGYKVFIDRL